MMTHSSAVKPEVIMSLGIVIRPNRKAPLLKSLDSYYKASPNETLAFVVVNSMSLFNPKEYREGCSAR